jgi:hypothetical protein
VDASHTSYCADIMEALVIAAIIALLLHEGRWASRRSLHAKSALQDVTHPALRPSSRIPLRGTSFKPPPAKAARAPGFLKSGEHGATTIAIHTV